MRKTLTTSSSTSKNNMNSPKIGTEIYTAAYASNGIIIYTPLIYPCQDTSSNSCKNINTIAHNVPHTAHTLHCPNNTEVKPSILSPQIHLPHYQRTTSSTYNASSEASSITPEPLTSPFSWPSAQLPANKQKGHKIPC